MEILVNTVIALENKKKYMVVAKVNYNGDFYDYLLQLNNNDISEHVVIIKEVNEDGNVYAEQVTDENVLSLLLPLFQHELEEKNDNR